jgi:hypothetical protein
MISLRSSGRALLHDVLSQEDIFVSINRGSESSRPRRGEIYRHFKGSLYQVIEVGKYEPDLREVVVYKSLGDGEVWVRPLSSWEEAVPDTNNRYGTEKKVLRFRLEREA